MAEKPYSPKHYLSKIQGRDYLPVAERIRWLNETQERFTVASELLHWSPDYAVVKATVTLLNDEGEAVRSATGHGQALVAKMPAHISSRAAEKAETAAVGRALGLLGLGTLAAQAFDDAADAHLADSPAAALPAAGGALQPAPTSPAYREPSEDEWVVFDDTVRERTGYSRADVCVVLGRTPAAHLRALHAAGTPKSGKALIADLIAHKREGREVPGAISAGVVALQDDLAPTRA